MKKHTLLTLIFIALISVSCKQAKKKNVKVLDSYKEIFTTAQLDDKLELALKQKQSDGFGKIFMDWNTTIKPNSEDFINQNDTINDVFKIYKEFYKPFNLKKLGEWEWGEDLNSKCKYAVVQNKILYTILHSDNFNDFDWEKSKLDSIDHFRPPVNLDKNKILYLAPEYAKSINKFLGTKSTKVGEGNIMNPSMPEGESEKRYELLRLYIPILHGHWGGYWHIETHPYINILIFNKSLTKANIVFRVGYQGGEATMEKKGDNWIIKESKTTWIE